MSRRNILAALSTLLLARPHLAVAARGPAPSPIVLELFTSQSCSSCPPAEALLAELAQSDEAGGLLPLAFHVTYWDRLGWKDRFSLPEATARQRRYAALWQQDGVYTPQLVVQGERDAVGSDRAAVLALIAAARSKARAGPAMALEAADGPDRLSLTVAAGRGAGRLWLIGFDPRQVTPVRGGENAGRTLVQTQIVRSIAGVDTGWRGEALQLALPRPAGGRAACLLQAADGRILAAAMAPAAG